MPRRRRRHEQDDPWAVLGLDPGSSEAQVHGARRQLAKDAHPDVGGSIAEMQRVNDAAERALRMIGDGDGAPRRPHMASRHAPSPGRRQEPDRRYGGARHDHPSFTVEALPAETFEALLMVAPRLGDVVLDDPPYELEVELRQPLRGWCRLDVVPDAGASTVSLAVAAEPGYPVPDLETVRDSWIEGLNRVDWADLGGAPPPS